MGKNNNMECCNQTIPTMLGESTFEETRCLRIKGHDDDFHLSLTMYKKGFCFWSKDYGCDCDEPVSN